MKIMIFKDGHTWFAQADEIDLCAQGITKGEAVGWLILSILATLRAAQGKAPGPIPEDVWSKYVKEAEEVIEILLKAPKEAGNGTSK
jgi:hypothetical protein